MTGCGLLAVSADASRTGAPRLLASLLAELSQQGVLDAGRSRVLLGVGGPAAEDLARSVPVRVLGRAAGLGGALAGRAHPTARGVGTRVGVALGLAAHPRWRDPGPPDLVWANGAGALPLVDALPRPARGAPLVAHVHELEIGIRRALDGRDPRRLLGRADVVVAVSSAVRDHLVDGAWVAPDRIAVHHGWLATDPTPAPASRRPPGVAADALVVGACGTLGWRKGTDLFLDLARRLPATVGGRPVTLVWVGGPTRPGDERRTAAEVRLRGVGDRVHLVGEVDDVRPWLAGFDVLVHPAREDPFPLVVLEAGAQGVPVVGFRSGGITEALPSDDHAASLADLFDVDGLAHRLEALLGDDGERARRGRALRDRVEAHHRAGPCAAALWADVSTRLGRA